MGIAAGKFILPWAASSCVSSRTIPLPPVRKQPWLRVNLNP